MKILVTGAAGFIGFHLARALAKRGDFVIGLDNINDYYDTRLKYARLNELGIKNPQKGKLEQSATFENLLFLQEDLTNEAALKELFSAHSFDAICNLAAQAGVRYSLENPKAYIRSNIDGFVNLLELARAAGLGHFVYASSSSVYGLNSKSPFSTKDAVDHPISLYAATKRSNELMAHTYSHLFGIPSTGLRFFTVYGPWGRPDMALFQFTKAILNDEPINIFNNGDMQRDFTYIDDIIDGVIRVIDAPAKPKSAASPEQSSAPFRIYNIGNSSPVALMDFVREIEKNIGKTAKKNFLPMQAGDVQSTHANVQDLSADLGYAPKTPVALGVKNFIDWYKKFYL